MSDSKKGKTNPDATVIVTEKVLLNEPGSHYEPYLIQISGRETGRMFNLKASKTVKLGRDASCQIILDDPHISRFHAEIIIRNNADIVLRDSGSTNGVFVNGRKVTEQALLDGDKILIGTRLYFKFCYQDAVEQTYQQNLFRAANMDSLTQLYNKKYFVDILSKEFSFARRNNQDLSLMMIDIDHFKQMNDTHGHVAGDVVLKAVGQYLQKHLRLENTACRFGGEEFAVILRNVNGEQAFHIAERLRKEIETSKVVFKQKELSITISIGISTLSDEHYDTIEDFIQSADEALYEAKEKGRNRTIHKHLQAA